MMRLDDYRRLADSQNTEWRVEYRPPVIYCEQCRWRDKSTTMCRLALYVVGPRDYCSKGEKAR